MRMPYFAALAAFAITYAVLAILYGELARRSLAFIRNRMALHVIAFLISLIMAAAAFEYAK
jgi:hypothetical protein